MSVSTAPGCAGARSEAEPGRAPEETVVRGGREARPDCGAGRARRHGSGPRPARPREARRGEPRRSVSVAARPGGAAECRPALTLIPGGLPVGPAAPAEWEPPLADSVERTVHGRCVPARRVRRRPAGARTVRRTLPALRYRVRRAAALVVLAVVAAGVVVGLGSLADATRDTGPGIPAATAQVVVGQGDTVWDIARRTAPDADPAAAAAHIAELNGLHSAALRPGQVLTAPAA
ncbi:MAG: LysM peptidoglycan-binding domain-containing protein [Pseudonocardia sp.]|nr:LysM peptidoglycan-binding domain-containing protein [Pseudonocardia sp.]